MPTASEQIYRKFLDAATDEERENLEGQLVAICIAACRHKHFYPPRERDTESEYVNGKPRWVGGPFTLPSWVRDWVGGQLSGEEPLKDGARYIGRRCVNVLIDKIRWHERRKRDAQIRNHWKLEDDPEEVSRLREAIAHELAAIGLPKKLRIEGDRDLLKRLMAAYPSKLSNTAIAREMGVSESAIRKRRRRISAACFAIADGSYQLRSTFERLGLKQGTKNRAYTNNSRL